MTALSVLDLDDAASLEAADSLGTLRSAALGGAHVRAVAEGVREDTLGRLAGLRPRTLLLVSGPGRARRAAGLLVAALGAGAGLPIVHVTTTPTWVGPLDVVLVSGDDAGDPRLVESVATAVRRGAEVVVAAPDEGPLRAAGAGRVIALPPRIRTTDHGALLRYLAAGLAVATAVDTTRSSWRAEELDHLADAVDAEALRDHPSHEVYDNPAKSLAARLQNRRAVLAGDGPATVELAGHGAEILLRAAGAVAAAADLADVLAGASMLASPNPSGAGYDPFFHDDQIDGPAPQEGVRVFVLGMTADRNAIMRRLRVLEDAEVVTVGEGPEPVGTDRTPAGEPPPGASSDLEQIAVLALRLEMAAAYLGLLRGPSAGAASASPALVPPSPTEGETV